MPSRAELISIAEQAIKEGDDATAHEAMDMIDRLDAAQPPVSDVPLVPGMQGYEAQQAAMQKPAIQEPSVLDKAGAALKAGGVMLGNAIPGTIGALGGSIYGLVSGQGEEEMARGAEQFSPFSTNDPLAQEYIANTAEALAPLAGIPVIGGEIGALSKSVRRPMAVESKAVPIVEQAAVKEIPQAEKTADLTASFANAGMKNRIDEITKGVTVDPAKVEAANRLGIDSPIATLSNDRSLQDIAGALAASPGSKASSMLSDYHAQLTNKAQQLIKDAGGDIDRGLVSAELKDKMDANIKLLKDQSAAIYQQIGDSVPPETIVNAKPLIRELNARASKSQKGIQGLSQVEQDVYNTLQGKPTYFDLDNLRKDIGESIGGFKGTYTTAPKAKLDDMYSKLTDLQAGVADQVGNGAGKLWDQAKSLDKARFNLQESNQFLFGKDLQGSVMPKVEQGLKQLAKGNAKTFNETIESIPKDMRHRVLMSGLDSVLSKTAQGESSLSPVQFNNWYGELSKSPTNKALLHKNLPEGAGQRLDDLFKLSQGLQNVTSKVVRTGIVHDAFKNFDATGGLVDKLYRTAEKVSEVPIVGSAVGAPAIRVGSSILKMAQAEKTPAIQAADDLLSSAEFKSAVLDYQKTGNALAPAQQKLKASSQFKNYLKQQDPKIVDHIAVKGFIPYLVSQDEKQ